MADYKEMYYHLFNRVTDWIEEMKAVQCEMEERYMQAEEPEIKIYTKKERSKG